MDQEKTDVTNNSQDTAQDTDDTAQPAQQLAPTPKTPKQHTFSRKKLILLVLTIILVVGAVSAGVTYAIIGKDTAPEAQSEEQKQEATQEIPEKTAELASAYTWLDQPKRVDPIPMFSAKDVETVGLYEHYELGSGADGTKIYAVAGQDEMGGRPYLIVLEKESAFTIVKKHSQGFFYELIDGGEDTYQGPELLPNVGVDSAASIADMTVPSDVTYKGQKFKTVYIGSDVPYITFLPIIPAASEYLRYEEVGTNDQGRVYEVISKDDPTYRVSRFMLRLKPALYADMRIEGELSREEIDPITWSDGSKNSENYDTAARGCGAYGGAEVAKYGKEAFVQLGKSTQGQIIYGFKDSSNELFKKHYDEYVQDGGAIKEWISGGDSTYSASDFGKNIEEYKAMRPLYVVEDAMGRFLVFARMDLVLTGGCAKPVVYLYPTTPTMVDVEVGASVTVSDPLYESDGWQNVFAMPNGLLGYNGVQYDSLFWEGLGEGSYPEVTKGFVIKREATVSTMREHLTAQGLNAKETSDFVEFWETKIPNTPFVRLSWLGTQDMERLAPLYISPAPDTRIRVFLDMEGLYEYENLPAQTFNAVPRSGFTVVEWGGLVMDGSVPLLK